MCNPAVIPYVIAAVGAVVQTVGQNQQAKRQAHAIEAQNEVAADEQADASSVDANELSAEAMRDRARVMVAAGESGLQGASFEGLLQNSLMQQSQDTALVIKNDANATRARQAQANSMLSGLQITNGAGIALNAGMAVAGTYAKNGSPRIGGSKTSTNPKK